MSEAHLKVNIHTQGEGPDLEFETASIATALTIAEINLVRGRAEICHGNRVIARLTRRGDHPSVFWEVG